MLGALDISCELPNKNPSRKLIEVEAKHMERCGPALSLLF
jgi:hypothetical protein